MLKTNTVNNIALLSSCISFWNALYIAYQKIKNLSERQTEKRERERERERGREREGEREREREKERERERK